MRVVNRRHRLVAISRSCKIRPLTLKRDRRTRTEEATGLVFDLSSMYLWRKLLISGEEENT